MDRFPTLHRLRPAHSEIPRTGDEGIDVALHEAQLWFNSIHGHIAKFYDDTHAGARNVCKCCTEVTDWLTVLSLRVAKYRKYHARPAPGASADPPPLRTQGASGGVRDTTHEGRPEGDGDRPAA
jgi:hypothetical protein